MKDEKIRENELNSLHNADLHGMQQLGELAKEILAIKGRLVTLEYWIYEQKKKENPDEP